ncbi:MAG: T9SS type A sorting domain-containing protein [Flavobacteriales bacterium]|nr:T9SS type A sorting domain-containing protein [Flavobacteriales bacterium]
MKKHLALFLLAVGQLIFSVSVSAGVGLCTPDEAYTSVGIWPAVQENGCENQPYDETSTFVYPNDTTVNIGAMVTLSLDSAWVTSVTGLPPGISYVCEDASCVFQPSGITGTSISCMKFLGTPTLSGLYVIAVNMDLRFSNAFVYPYTFNINITIDGSGVGSCIGVGVENLSTIEALSVSPNPTSGLVNLNQKVTGKVLDLLGNGILDVKNANTIDLSNVASGMYILSTGSGSVKILKR